MNRKDAGEVLRFGVVGVVATAIHYAVYYLLLRWVDANVAYTVGYGLSFLVNYVLSSMFTFGVALSVSRFVGFGLSHLTNYVVQLVLLNVFMALGVDARVAPLPVFAVAIPINFLLVRYALTRVPKVADGYVSFLLLSGVGMLLLCMLDVPTLSDDMIYRFMWQADDAAEVQTIGGMGDLLQSQWVHYQCVNGRLPVHFIAQAFLVFVPPVVFQVLNALLFVVLLHACATLVGGSHRLFVASLSAMLLFVVFSGFRSAVLWQLGSFNYLWVLVPTMALLLWLRRGGGGPLWLSPVALLVGWSHEALSLPLSVAFAAWLLFGGREARGSRYLPYLLFYMAGTMLCLLSPGIWARSADAVSLTSRLLSGAVNCVSNVRITWLLLLTLLLLWRRNKTLLLGHLSRLRYGYVVLSASLGIVLLCGTNLERVAFFTDVMAMLLWLSLLQQALSASWRRRLLWAAMALLVLSFVPAYMVRRENRDCWLQAERQMKEPGRELIGVPMPASDDPGLCQYFRRHYAMQSFEFGFYCVYMGFDANDVNTRCAARLYDKQRLVFLPADVAGRMATDSTAYRHYELSGDGSLYVWQLPDSCRDITTVRFVLRDEDLSQLWPHQRLLAYQGDSYELDDFHHEVIGMEGRRYLVFTRPTTNIFRRINYIEYE